MSAALDRLRAIADDEQRAAEAAKRMRNLDAEIDAVREVRDGAVLALLAAGRKKAEVARIIGTTRGFMAYFDAKTPAAS